MRIATWNVNGLRARQDFLLHWLRARQPDVVGLQELKLTDEQFPHLELEAEGYHAVTHGQKSWNGVGVLTKERAEVTERGLPGQEDFGARLITVKVSGITFCTVYVPNGKSVSHEDYPKKLAWLDRLKEHLAESSVDVVCGDFNVVPEPIDSWNEDGLAGHIFHTDEERRRIAALKELGYVDLFRTQHPDEAAFSWWDYRGGAFHKRQGLRIDFLLGKPGVAERVTSAEIDRDYRKKKDGLTPSDHAPVMVELSG
ncbi:MAG: exodeoxyribonuclease III [Myxococcales bacterium]|nr:exodeoxyribonuclease III [Myxococcales bacterium]MCB9577836.1 exodeoxyribonuclease III [Polyangiaceae bacterium]